MFPEENRIFKTGPIFRVVMGVIAYISANIGAYIVSGNIHFAMTVIIAIATALVIGQKITIFDNGMMIKQGLITMKFPFAESSFRLEKRTGLKSYLLTFRPETTLLYVATAGKKEKKINFMLSAKDTEDMLTALKQKVAVAV